MLANIAKDTKSFLTWLLRLYTWCQTLQVTRNIFAEEFRRNNKGVEQD